MSHPRRRLGRLTALGGALLVPVAALAAIVPQADAARVGYGTLSGSSHDQDDYLVMTTSAPCPSGTSKVKMTLTGGSVSNDGANNLMGLTSVGLVSSGAGMVATATVTLKDLWSSYADVAPSGQYVARILCTDDTGSADLGTFDATLAATTTSGAYNATWAPVSNATATTTKLAASPLDPVAQGTTSTLTATVTPTAAAGKVQFKNGTADLGTPVTVSGGQAQYAGKLPAGSRSLTAVFTPTDSAAYASSTSSALTYVVAGTPAITGTVQVGKSVTCTLPAGGTQTFVWKLGGTATTTTTKTVTVPATWASKSLTCAATATRSGRSVTVTSPAKTVAKGVFTTTTRPVAGGTAKVGSTLTCSKGAWSPTPSSYAFRWLRNGVLISGTAATHKLVSADRGKNLACRVTVSRAGYTAKSATSAARKVS